MIKEDEGMKTWLSLCITNQERVGMGGSTIPTQFNYIGDEGVQSAG